MFVGLHNHTMYSLLDSISKPDSIISRLQEIGQTAFAVTDHGHLYNTTQIYKKFKKAGIKLIVGCEVYICSDINIKDKDNRYYHLVLLAKNEQGRLNLNKLVSLGNTDGKYYKPRIDFNLLQQYHNGLIVLSSCMAGEIQKAIVSGNIQNAKAIALQYHELFKDDYYLEIQAHEEPLQIQLNKQVVDLAQELGIQYVVTTDSHYVNAKDQKYHSMFVQVGQEREVGETYTDCFIQSEEEVRTKINYLNNDIIDTAIIHTELIANKCDCTIPLSAPIIPHVEINPMYKDEVQYLKHLCNAGWKHKGINTYDKPTIKRYKDRLMYEIDAVTKMGFEGYYLLVEDYVAKAKERGPGRGSVGGSLIAYLIGITDVDPIKYDLYFERFIDVSALDALQEGKITKSELKIPDVDTDFSKSSREETMQYIYEKYGSDRVASIGTFQFLWAKGTIKDIGKVLGIPFEVTNAITKSFDKETIEEVLELGLVDGYVSQYPELFEYVKALSGLPKSFSKHASGKIIAVQDMNYYHAITETDGDIVLELDMYCAEDLGLVKIDLLGLRTVGIFYSVLRLLNKTPEYLDVNNMGLDDPKVYEIFKNGNTENVFQFSSRGMQEVLKKISPNNIEDIAACNALFRPGAMAYIDNYADCKNGKKQVTYLHPDLEPILNNTYGCLVYQEQLIAIGRLAGLRNPDKLRKATGKKDMVLLQSLEPDVKNGLISRGWSQDQVDTLWIDMLNFGRYAFNKSHSVAYALIAYIAGYLKVYHPNELSCATFNSLSGEILKIAIWGEESKRLGVKFDNADWKTVEPLCNIVDGKNIYGTELIKSCNAQNAIDLKALNVNQYSNFLDLLIDIETKTSINTKQLTILTTLNYFSEFGKNKLLLKYIEWFKQLYGSKTIKKDKWESLGLIECGINIDLFSKPTEKTYKDLDWYNLLKAIWFTIPNESLSARQQIQAEKEYLGYAISTYPNASEYICVVDIDTKHTPVITGYNFTTGLEQKYKVYKKNFYTEATFDSPKQEQLIHMWDVLKIGNTQEREQSRKVNDDWVGTGVMETILNSWSKVVKK